MLTKRQKNILRLLISNYINTATPVSSQQLVSEHRLQYSPATVRNEFIVLEELGYIQQPHVSAGRIPTDKGYRCYVDSLMRVRPLPEGDATKIQYQIMNSHGDVALILENTSKILGKISRELGVVLTPQNSMGIFDHLELVGLSEAKVLVIIHVKGRMRKTVVLRIQSDLRQSDLKKTARLLNERLSGLTLEEVQHSIQMRVRDTYDMHPDLLKTVTESAPLLFDFSMQRDVHTSGAQNMLSHPEFGDSNMLSHILQLIENRDQLSQLFHGRTNNIHVTIGCENNKQCLGSFSVIGSTYHIGDEQGILGVIGPTRMEYHRILPLVDYMSRTISQFLG